MPEGTGSREATKVIDLNNKSTDDLLKMRSDIIAKTVQPDGSRNHETLTDDDLHLLVAVVAKLRRTNSGPPKEKRARSATPGGKKTLSVSDATSLFS